MIIMVSGGIGQGKSSLLGRTADYLLHQGQDAQGLLSERVLLDGTTVGYNLRLLPGSQRQPLSEHFARSSKNGQKPGTQVFGGWLFYERALAAGLLAIRRGLEAEYLFIDEVGRWELDNGGWAEALPPAFAKTDLTVLLGVRRDFVRDVSAKFALTSPEIIDLDSGPDPTFAKLLNSLARARN